MRAASAARSRSACCASSRALASRSSRSSSAARGALVLGVEALLAGVEPGDLGLQGGEVALGPRRPGPRPPRGPARSRPISSSAAAARRLQGVDLAVQPGQALAAVGGGAGEPGDPALLLGRGVLGRLAGRRRRPRAPYGVRSTSAAISLLLLAHPLGLGLELVGVAAGSRSSARRVGGVADPLGGQRLGAAQPLAQPGQREPGLLGRRQRGQVARAAPPRARPPARCASAIAASTSARGARPATVSSASSCSSGACAR